VTTFIQGVKNIGFPVAKFATDELYNFEIFLESGGRILSNGRRDLSKTLENLFSFITGGTISIKNGSFLSNLDYIDLRYGNKIFYKMRNGDTGSANTSPNPI
jgi:hypothetical protein